MDWAEQSLEMMKSWTEMQQKLWQGWLDAASTVGKTETNPLADWIAQWQETSTKSIKAWEDLTAKMVETQAHWFASDALKGEWLGRDDDLRKMADAWSEQTLAVMKAWTAAQQQLWDQWFSAAAGMARSSLDPGNNWYEQWRAAAKASMSAWEDLNAKTAAMQTDWFKGWEPAATSPQPGATASGPGPQPGQTESGPGARKASAS